MGRIVLKPNRMVITAYQSAAGGDFSTRLYIDRPSELRELADSFNRMAHELGGIELLRSDFVNNFSHEFKTPIVSIKGFAEMLKLDDLTQEERNEYLDIVISESGRLAALATNILNLSKVENQTILSDKQPFDLAEQIGDVSSCWNQLGAVRPFNVRGFTGYTLCRHEEQLNQVWLNLLNNAVKFTPRAAKSELLWYRRMKMAIFVLPRRPGIGADSMGTFSINLSADTLTQQWQRTWTPW
jgi:signal transduction histidine kinase